jgi:hypothetical protein
MPGHRLHVLPWLRPIGGRLLLPNWLAITLGSHIFSWRNLDPVELAHELEHVRQWQRYGVLFAARYLRASFRSWLAGSGWYGGNKFEVAARRAAASQRAVGSAIG